MTDDIQKPRPPVRAYTVHELRRVVTARNKVLLANGTEEEALALMREQYGANEDSARAFVAWLKGETVQDERGAPRQVVKNEAIDRIHVVTDMKTGDERYIDTQPGSIPPRPVKPPAKR